MNYIIIDLEWNQCPLGRGIKELPFEIIEIGAVKLNSTLDNIDEFREVIRPQVYQDIHVKTKEIIHLNMETLYNGRLFQDVAHKFFSWCGKDYIFCTWGTMDLTELQRNLDYYKLTGYFKTPIKYYDIQKLFSLYFEGYKNPRTLSYAIDYLQIECKDDFHRALFDAKYTAEIFKKLDQTFVERYYSLDYYHNPKKREEEILIIFDNYSKFVSMEYNTKEDIFKDKIIKDVNCFICNEKAIRKLRWFTNNSKIYYCLGYCKEHGFLKGKIRIKKSSSGKYFAVKTIKLIGTDIAESLRIKHEEIIVKKKLRKKRNKTTTH